MVSKTRNTALILALVICVDAGHANATGKLTACIKWVVNTLSGRTYLRPEVWTARRQILVAEKARATTEYLSAMRDLARTSSRKAAEVSIHNAYGADVRYCNAHNEIAVQEDGFRLSPLDRYYVGENLAKSFYTWDRGAMSLSTYRSDISIPNKRRSHRFYSKTEKRFQETENLSQIAMDFLTS